MADVDKSSKTEPPTEKRLSDARSRGQFAKAPEIGMTATLIVGTFIIFTWGPSKSADLMIFTQGVFENIDSITATQEGMSHILTQSYISMALIVLPLMFGCFFASLIAEGVQTGFRFTPKAAEPKLSKMNPIKGVQRILGMKALKTFLVDFLKFIAIGSVVCFTILIFLDDPIFYSPILVQYIPSFILKLLLIIFLILILLMSVVAVIHYIIKKKENDDEMKMTKQEVKEERKSKEVSSEVKSAQRKKAMELVMGQNLQNVSTADVVVTNPTHFAVALRYEKGTDNAPVVVAKGEDLLARRIKSIAREYEVPTVENKPVARMLYDIGVVGLPIPLQLYQVVAEILAQVYQTHAYYFHRLKARRLLAKGDSSLSFS